MHDGFANVRDETHMRSLVIAGLAGLVLGISATQAAPIRVVAAENVYGDVAQQIGGSNVEVASILTNPSQDPHEFEASASTARQVADARIVIYNGADYDPWMPKLLAASRAPSRKVIEVARLVYKRAGDNPHVWYDVAAIFALAKVLGDTLSALDPDHRTEYAERHAAFERSMQPLVDAHCQDAQGVLGQRGHRDRARLRLHGRRAGAQDAQRPLSARGHERHRAKRKGHRRIRAGSQVTIGQGAALQQPDRATRSPSACARLQPKPAFPSSVSAKRRLPG